MKRTRLPHPRCGRRLDFPRGGCRAIERFCPILKITRESEQRLIIQLYGYQPTLSWVEPFDDSSLRNYAERWLIARIS